MRKETFIKLIFVTLLWVSGYGIFGMVMKRKLKDIRLSKYLFYVIGLLFQTNCDFKLIS